MKSRERVFAALNHQQPDRVPLALGGGPYGVVDPLYHNLLQYLKLGNPVPPFRSGHSISYMDDRLLEKLGTDLRYCWPGLLPNSPVIQGEDIGLFMTPTARFGKKQLPIFIPAKDCSKKPMILTILNASYGGQT